MASGKPRGEPEKQEAEDAVSQAPLKEFERRGKDEAPPHRQRQPQLGYGIEHGRGEQDAEPWDRLVQHEQRAEGAHQVSDESLLEAVHAQDGSEEGVLHEPGTDSHEHRPRRRARETEVHDDDDEEITVARQRRRVARQEGLRQGGGGERHDTAHDPHREALRSGGPSGFSITRTSSRRRKSTSGRSSTSLVRPSPSPIDATIPMVYPFG